MMAPSLLIQIKQLLKNYAGLTLIGAVFAIVLLFDIVYYILPSKQLWSMKISVQTNILLLLLLSCLISGWNVSMHFLEDPFCMGCVQTRWKGRQDHNIIIDGGRQDGRTILLRHFSPHFSICHFAQVLHLLGLIRRSYTDYTQHNQLTYSHSSPYW